MKNFSRAAIVLLTLVFLAACGGKTRPELTAGPGWTTKDNNLHLIDGPQPNGQAAYRLYRSGMPTKETFAKWCGEYKIQRVIVMSGDAATHELAYQKEGICPNIEIVYNVEQKVEVPVTEEFLMFFDAQVEQAKKEGVGLLFRCQTGSHRTGRLAAYYQMKYQGLTSDEAIAVMDHLGMMMPVMDTWLRPQVRAIEDYLKGRKCSQEDRACVQKK
jgi:protein-tyrosine phosphatase